MPQVRESYRRNMRFVEAFSPSEMRKRHGEFYAYHPDGQLAMSGHYLHGMPNGTWRRWYGNGHLASVHNYSAGVLHGPYVQYFDNGKKAREGQYVQGAPDGTHRIYYKHGQDEPSMFTIVDSKLTELSIRSEAFALRYDQVNGLRLNGSTLRCAKICFLRDNGTLVCKTPDQIITDLSTFVNPEHVAELMNALDSLYDHPDLQLGAREDILVGCAGTLESAASIDGPPVDLSEFAYDGSPLNRAPMTQPEVDKLLEKCTQAAWQRQGLDPGTGDFDNQWDSFVSDTTAQIDDAIGTCREPSNESIQLHPAIVGALIGAGAVIIAAGIEAGGDVGSAYLEKTLDDGYEPAANPHDNPTIQKYKTDPQKTKETHRGSNPEDNYTVFQGPTEAGEPGVRKRTVVSENGSALTTFYDENGRAIADQFMDAEGNKDPISYAISATLPAEESGNNGSDTGNAPTGDGSTTPDVDMPQDESGMSRCQQIAAAWEAKKAHCETSHWQTYECAQLLRTFNGCVDLALINPGPDGDVTCPHYGDEAAAELARRACEQKGWRMLPSGFDSVICRDVDFDAVPPKGDLCSDPRIMCLPDRIVSDNGGEPEMLGSSALRQTLGRTGIARSERRLANETLRGAYEPAMSWIRTEDEGFVAIDDESFDDFLMDVSTPALVVFGARNCPPCKRVKRNLSAVMDQFPEDIEMRYVEVPQNPMIAQRFRIQYTPTIVMFERGTVIGQRRVGAATPEILLKWVQRCLRVRDHGQASKP